MTPDGQTRAGSRGPGRSTGGSALLVLALGCAGVLLVLLALAARTAPVSPVTQVPSFAPPSPPPVTASVATPPPAPTAPAAPLESSSPSWVAPLLEVLAGLAVVLGVGVLALAVVLVVRAVRQRQRPEGIDETLETVVDVDEVREHLARSQHDIDVDGDANRAVVRCWQGLEQLAATAGAPREAHQTAREYTVAVLTGAQLPAGPVERLAGVYEDALFSGERLPESARRTALEALGELREAVERDAPDARTGAGTSVAGSEGASR